MSEQRFGMAGGHNHIGGANLVHRPSGTEHLNTPSPGKYAVEAAPVTPVSATSDEEWISFGARRRSDGQYDLIYERRIGDAVIGRSVRTLNHRVAQEDAMLFSAALNARFVGRPMPFGYSKRLEGIKPVEPVATPSAPVDSRPSAGKGGKK